MTTEPKPFCGKCGARRAEAADKFCPDCGVPYSLSIATTAPEERFNTASDAGGRRGANSWNPDFEELIGEAEGGPDITKYEDVTDEMPSRYPETIKEAWRQVLVFALDNEEYVALRNNAEFPGIERYMDLALLTDLCRAYDSGASLVKLEEYEPAERIAMAILETRACLLDR